MKEILLSIHPKWCEKILSGEKTIEVRKSVPKEVPFKTYIYCTKSGDRLVIKSDKYFTLSKLQTGKVIGEFICDKVDTYCYRDFGYEISEETFNKTMLTGDEFCCYGKGKPLYGWHISDLKMYDKPKYLNEITPFCKYKGERCECCSHYVEVFGGCCKTLKRPPQSWQYIL